MNKTFKVPMKPLVIISFLLMAIAVAGVVAWSFRSGIYWTGICLLVVALPLGGFYWYMLYVNPARTEITLSDEGVLVYAPPFVESALPWGNIESVFTSDLENDDRLAVKKTKRIMKYGSYRAGLVTLAGENEAVIVARQSKVVCIVAGGRYYLLGPSDIDQFEAEINSRLG